MTSVAYPAPPQLPGWIHSTLSLVVGWLASAAAISVLYVAATFVGGISQPYGWHAGVVNEWPFVANGLWSLLANVAVVCIAIVLATVATSWWLRRKHPRVSDGRLAVVLVFCGWVPLATAGPRGLFGFLVALVLVRYWVARHADHLAPAHAAALVAVLGAVVLSYGLLHPLWTTDVSPTTSLGKQRVLEIYVHNAARAGVTIDRIEVTPFLRPARPARLHLAPKADGTIVLSVPPGGCGRGIFDIRTHYHVFGLALSQTLPARVSYGRGC
jgi:hypothetical protein